MKAKQADANVILVHGAFGCGKSYLLVSIIRYIATLLDQMGESETKILVCALTNVAVDRILLTLKEQNFTDFARVGSLKKIDRRLLPFTHTSSSNKKKADKDALKELKSMLAEIEAQCGPNGQMLKSQFEEAGAIQDCIDAINQKSVSARHEILQSKRVIGATCAATGFECMKNMQFKIVILDECSQMLEP